VRCGHLVIAKTTATLRTQKIFCRPIPIIRILMMELGCKFCIVFNIVVSFISTILSSKLCGSKKLTTVREVVETMNLLSYWKYKLKVSKPQIHFLYGLPKTHKEGNKIRPITQHNKKCHSFFPRARLNYS
jgi:hypothetical protein